MIPLNPNLSALQRSGIRRYSELAKEVPGCVMLTLGEPEAATAPAICAAAEAALRSGHTHYAPNQGLLALRQAIAAYETDRGMICTPEQLLITAGATGALFTALLGILEPGDEVIVPTPAFPLYESILTMAGAKLIPYDLRQNGFQIHRETLLPLFTSKTKAIVLNSPHNPTGTVLSADSLAAVKEAVLGKPVYVICDNVYTALTENCPDLSLDPQLQPQLLLCQSFSKPYAMTGWRAGWLAGPTEVISRLLLLNAAQIAGVPTFVQHACIAALEQDITPAMEAYQTNRAYVCRRLTAMGLSFPQPEGAFYVFPDISFTGLSDEEFCTRLIREAGVATVPGSCFGCPGHIRISCCCSQSALEEGMDRLEAFLKKL